MMMMVIVIILTVFFLNHLPCYLRFEFHHQHNCFFLLLLEVPHNLHRYHSYLSSNQPFCLFYCLISNFNFELCQYFFRIILRTIILWVIVDRWSCCFVMLCWWHVIIFSLCFCIFVPPSILSFVQIVCSFSFIFQFDSNQKSCSKYDDRNIGVCVSLE